MEAATDDSPQDPSVSRWRIPGWYRRIGLVSWLFLGVVAAVALLAWVIAATSEITSPLVLGAFFAVVFLPVVDWLALRRFPRSLAAMTVLIGLILLIAGVTWLSAAALIDQGDELSASLDGAVADIESWLDDTPVNEELVGQIRETANDAGPAVTGGLGSSAVSLVDSAFALVAGLILGTIVLYYLLKDLPTIGANYLEKHEDDDEREVLRRIGERTVYNVQNYFRGRTAMALVNGVAIGPGGAALRGASSRCDRRGQRARRLHPVSGRVHRRRLRRTDGTRRGRHRGGADHARNHVDREPAAREPLGAGAPR